MSRRDAELLCSTLTETVDALLEKPTAAIADLNLLGKAHKQSPVRPTSVALPTTETTPAVSQEFPAAVEKKTTSLHRVTEGIVRWGKSLQSHLPSLY